MPFAVLPFSLLLMETLAPPPVVRVDAPRPSMAAPVIMTEGYRSARELRARRATIAVEATGGGQTLWSGTLRVGGYGGGANVSRSLRQAPPYGCPADPDEGYRSEENSFNMGLNMQRPDDGVTRYRFNVSWQRPGDSCSEAMIQRSVQLSGTASLAPGQSVSIQGDAGLVLRLKLVNESSGAARP